MKSVSKFANLPTCRSCFLTARGDEIDRVVGLEIGGDDYVVKPFSPRELVARVKVILRRRPQLNHSKPASTSLFQLDADRRRIRYNNIELELTAYEYGILKHLLSQPERVYSREQLMNAVWSTPQASFDRAVDTHIKTLRAKLRAITPEFDPVITHRGAGYAIKTRMDSGQ